MISLKELAENIDMSNPEMEAVLNLKTGKIILITDEYVSAVDKEDIPDWMSDIIPDVKDYLNNPDNYINLPNQHDFYGYRAMKNFVNSLPDSQEQEVLQKAIIGKGAFRQFKEKIGFLGVEDQWYKFKEAAITEFAKDWAKDNDIQFTE